MWTYDGFVMIFLKYFKHFLVLISNMINTDRYNSSNKQKLFWGLNNFYKYKGVLRLNSLRTATVCNA